jgi:hypothetical protein
LVHSVHDHLRVLCGSYCSHTCLHPQYVFIYFSPLLSLPLPSSSSLFLPLPSSSLSPPSPSAFPISDFFAYFCFRIWHNKIKRMACSNCDFDRPRWCSQSTGQTHPFLSPSSLFPHCMVRSVVIVSFF